MGAFKFRGAQNAVACLAFTGPIQSRRGDPKLRKSRPGSGPGRPTSGYCHSYWYAPANASKTKIAAVREYGTGIRFCEPTVGDRKRLLEEVQRDTGATYVLPYDHPTVISHQRNDRFGARSAN
ncbi:MAG: hypothetical protein M2R45_01880 [Verrucomicrobia subdivision 3 bacterium]|nr:hypothetical protein [Limisphaerales bacterium]